MKVMRKEYLPFGLIVLLMSAIVSQAFADVTPNYPPNWGFYGYVVDSEGIGIPGATVRAGDYEGTTNASGFYNIGVNEQLSTTVKASKTGYFTQETTAATIIQPTRVDFQLAEDTETWVTFVALFPNTRLAYMKHTSSSWHTITVKSYTAGSGNTQTTTDAVETGIDAPGYPVAWKRNTEITGIYDESGSLHDLFVKKFTNIRVAFYESEYLNPNEVSGEVWGLLPRQSVERTYSLSGSTTVQGGLKTSVSVSIPPGWVGASVELETTLAVAIGYEDKVYWKITNDSPDYRYYFKIYMEDNIIPHIWYIGKELVGTPPVRSSSGGGSHSYPK